MSAALIRITPRLLFAISTKRLPSRSNAIMSCGRLPPPSSARVRPRTCFEALQLGHGEQRERRAAVSGEERGLTLHLVGKECLDRRRRLVLAVRRMEDLERRGSRPSGKRESRAAQGRRERVVREAGDEQLAAGEREVGDGHAARAGAPGCLGRFRRRVAQRELREATWSSGTTVSSPVSVERTIAGGASAPRPRDTEKYRCSVMGFTAMSRITS